MTNPLITLSFFKNLKETTHYKTKYGVYLYGDENLSDFIDGAIEVLREPDAPRNVCLADYEDVHTGKSLISNGAIVMEWNAIVAPQVRAVLADTMWAHIIVDTEGSTDNRVAVIIPLAEPITESSPYTQVVSLLSKFFGVYHLCNECWVNTYGIKFQPFAKSEFVNGTVFNATNFLAKHKGVWSKASDYVGPEPIKKIATPAFAKGIGKQAAKVQLDMPDGASDMFDGL